MRHGRLGPILLLAAPSLVAGDDAAKEKPGDAPVPQRIEAPTLGLEATFDLPGSWSGHIESDGGASGYKDPRIRDSIAKELRLPNGDFEIERGWNNNGEVLAQLRLRLGRKEFEGTAQELADRCVSEIREKWPAFKTVKPARKPIALRSGPALYVSLESRKEPPYRVHFVVLVVEGKGCGLFCYGWGPQVNLVDLSGEGAPASVRKIAEDARRLSAVQLKRQAALFREFETVIVPTLRAGKPPPPRPPESESPDPPR